MKSFFLSKFLFKIKKTHGSSPMRATYSYQNLEREQCMEVDKVDFYWSCVFF